MKKFVNLLIVLTGISQASAAPLPDYGFKSPAFNGNGYSSHVLTIENQEHARRETLKKEIQELIKELKEALGISIGRVIGFKRLFSLTG